MSRVISGITTSVDGYVTGPNDGPGCGLGEGGERLHYWVFGGPWSYETGTGGEPVGADKEYLERAFGSTGAVIGGRNTYEAAEHWGDENPFGVPFFILTHGPEDPHPDGFEFVNGLDEAVARAREAAGDKDVSVMGGADVIRQALRAGYVEELTISVAPVVLGAGKRLFDGSEGPVELEPVRVLQSPMATHLTYRVAR